MPRDAPDTLEEFSFEVPVTNLKLDISDVIYSKNEVTAEFETHPTEISNKDGVTCIHPTRNPEIQDLDKCKNRNVSKLNNIGIDDENKSTALQKGGNAIAYEAQSENGNNLQDPERAIVIDATGSQNAVIDVDALINKDVKETEAIDLDHIRSKKSIAIDDKEVTESAMALDETEEEAQSDNVIVLDGNKTDSETTIIIDDDKLKKLTEKYPSNPIIIDIDNGDVDDCSFVESSATVKHKKNKVEYDEAYKENPLFAQLIEKCLNMENTDGMSRVINKTLLGIYKDVDNDYKKSEAFRKVLTQAIMQLQIEPQRKFSHLKNLCDELKGHRVKKRVQFITLEERGDKDQQSTSGKPRKRRRLEAIIDLDDEDISQKPPKEYPPIEIDDDDSNSDALLNDGDNVIFLDKNGNSNKENDKKKRLKKETRKIPKRKRGRPRKSDSCSTVVRNPFYVSNSKNIANPTDNSNAGQDRIPSTSNTGSLLEHRLNVNTDQDINRIPSTPRSGSLIEPELNTNMYQDIRIPILSDPGELLQPREAENMFMLEFNQQKIKHIESKIADLKKRLEELEECEVTTDCNMSPYIICEHLKATIVKLYNELCRLTGTEVTKRHEVRLQVTPGHPDGPVRCLEEFLNESIDSSGNPSFPDMHDVIQCVWKANTLYNLNWNQPQIMTEAHALFIQFGRSMQKRRQKREWKDLMSRVKHEAPDPAEENPALQERLFENSLIARRNEDELLERFAKLEHGLVLQPDPQLRLSVDQSDESDDESDVDAPDPDNILSTADHPPEAASGLSTVEPPNCDNIRPIESIGSSVTVSGGNIVIQPTIKYGVGPNQTLPNSIQRKALTLNSEITLYSSEFQRFIKSQDKSKNHANICFSAGTNCVPSKQYISSKELSNVQSNDLGNATNLSKQILSLVQADCVKANGLEKDKNNHVLTNHCTDLKSFSPTVKLTNLNSNNVLAITSECNINNLGKNQTEDGFKIYTHTTKCKGNVNNNTELITHCNEEIASIKEFNIPCENDDKQTNPSVLEVLQNMETVQTETVDSNTDENVKHIVKPEPLDIPAMLEGLGQDFTATIFDIEDPFLVIEISDSSESENEEM